MQSNYCLEKGRTNWVGGGVGCVKDCRWLWLNRIKGNVDGQKMLMYVQVGLKLLRGGRTNPNTDVQSFAAVDVLFYTCNFVYKQCVGPSPCNTFCGL